MVISNDEFKVLTIAEIISALLPFQIPRPACRTRSHLIEFVQSLGGEQQLLLEMAIIRKRGAIDARIRANTARRAEVRRRARARRQEEIAIVTERRLNGDINKFMDLPTEAERRECHKMFIERTGNEFVKKRVCVCCARRLWPKEGHDIILRQLKNAHLLQPELVNPQQERDLVQGMLLVKEEVKDVGLMTRGWFCTSCTRSLSQRKRPLFSLANNMWIGSVPQELQGLTMSEQLLIAHAYPRCYVYKLHPKDGDRYHDPDTLQRGMKGNVTSYSLNVGDVAAMIDGRKSPKPLAILPRLIGVCIIGKGSLPKNWKKNTFGVRREVVRRALIWLKENNHLYRDIELSEAVLETYPEDDVPEEIDLLCRRENDEEIAEREAAGYVPSDDESDGQERNDKDIASEFPIGNTNSEELQRAMHDEGEGNDHHEDGSNEAGEVTSLQYLGVSSADMMQISGKEIGSHVLQNLLNSETGEGGYAVRHGQPLSDFDSNDADAEQVRRDFTLMAGAYPLLFPYGLGGFNYSKRNGVTFIDHVRWALQYHDRRFAVHHSFPFVAFAMEQKMQALRAVKAQMRRKDFERDADALGSITAEDLKKADQEERNGQGISNPAVKKLFKHLKVISAKVMGSNESRAALRAKIFGTTVTENPPNIWTTWNPHDRDDPVAQAIAGHDIDLDKFDKLLGPSKDERTKTIAMNPLAAAEYFHFIVDTLLDTLFGIENTPAKIKRRKGIFGKVKAYFGVIEAQGRGNLHLHMLMWLEDNPTMEEMSLHLKSDEFREKMKTFICRNIRADLEGLSPDMVNALPKENELAWNRPVHPDAEDYSEKIQDVERRVVRSQQIHTCRKSRCLRMDIRKQKYVCKRRAPFPLSDETFVEENGKYGLRRTHPRMNAYLPDLSVVTAMNNDGKVITNGAETKDSSHYMTKYTTKGQSNSYNISALVAKGVAYHIKRSPYNDDLLNANRLMLFRCYQSLSREMEYSGSQVASYLMGWGDTVQSHEYVSLYWSSVENMLKRNFRDLKPAKRTTTYVVMDIISHILSNHKRGSTENAQDGAIANDGNTVISAVDDADDVEDRVSLSLIEGSLVSRSQLVDYSFRGEELAPLSLLDFVKNTYEAAGTYTEVINDQDAQDTASAARGRPRHQRVNYLPGHSHCGKAYRIVRPIDHKVLLSIPGQYFPRNNDTDIRGLYCASMLALLKPWRSPLDLKTTGLSWEAAFAQFVEASPKRIRDILSNIQYYYESSDAAAKRRQEEEAQTENDGQRSKRRRDLPDDELQEEEEELTSKEQQERILQQMEESLTSLASQQYGKEAVVIGRLKGLLANDNAEATMEPCNSRTGNTLRRAEGDDYLCMENWRKTLNDYKSPQNGPEAERTGATTNDGDVVTVEDAGSGAGGVLHLGSEEKLPKSFPVANGLNDDQRRAYIQVKNHLFDVLSGDDTQQLLMNIQGGPGTGKSQVIKAITELFESENALELLSRTAYTGIAASVIDGQTLHTFAKVQVNGGDPGRKALGEMAGTLQRKKYLIIDEISMISKPFFAQLDRIMRAARDYIGSTKSQLPFGGLNVIICGDFHQFPPVAGKKTGALYARTNPNDSHLEGVGRELYEKFNTVVILKQQMRSQDDRWNEILANARTGSCTSEDLKELRSLVLTDRTCIPTDLGRPEWQDAVLVTPRHAVRHLWNKEAVSQHCKRNNVPKIICKAEDTINGRPLTFTEKLRCVTKQSSGQDKSHSGKADGGMLPSEVELAVGMKVMVLFNVNTEVDIANGACGTIVRIVLHEAEEAPLDQHVIRLHRMPAYVIVKLDRTKAEILEGLDANEIPIEPMERPFRIVMPDGATKTVTRQQLPLTAGYAFTDYKSQGQTIPYVIVDIGKPPPPKSLTPFNAYVALSRSKGRRSIRLLRDFENRLFTEPPDVELTVEDSRLVELDIQNKTTMAC